MNILEKISQWFCVHHYVIQVIDGVPMRICVMCHKKVPYVKHEIH